MDLAAEFDIRVQGLADAANQREKHSQLYLCSLIDVRTDTIDEDFLTRDSVSLLPESFVLANSLLTDLVRVYVLSFIQHFD